MKKTALFLFLGFYFFAPPALPAGSFTVSHVADGDTLVLDSGETVRLIGVDTPEMGDEARNRQSASRNHLNARTVHDFAGKAKQFARREVEGKTVRLEYDWQRRDKYSRVLAYVYREPDGFFLNAEIIRQGFGFVMRAFPFKYSDDFSGYAEEARSQKRGLWK